MKTPYSEEDNKEVQKYVKKIIKILRNPPSDFPTFILKKHLRGCYGVIDDEYITIAIFYDPITTIIHEILHFLYSEWRETTVLQKERLIRRYIRICDIKFIFKYTAKLL